MRKGMLKMEVYLNASAHIEAIIKLAKTLGRLTIDPSGYIYTYYHSKIGRGHTVSGRMNKLFQARVSPLASEAFLCSSRRSLKLFLSWPKSDLEQLIKRKFVKNKQINKLQC